jgi:hypothetical protein
MAQIWSATAAITTAVAQDPVNPHNMTIFIHFCTSGRTMNHHAKHCAVIHSKSEAAIHTITAPTPTNAHIQPPPVRISTAPAAICRRHLPPPSAAATGQTIHFHVRDEQRGPTSASCLKFHAHSH